MSWQQVYCITRLDSVCVALMIVMVIAFGIAMFCGLGIVINSEDGPESWKPFRKVTIRSAIVGIVAMIINVLIPSTKEAAAIYLIPKISNNEQAKDISKKGLNLLEAKFDEWLKDTMGEDKTE